VPVHADPLSAPLRSVLLVVGAVADVDGWACVDTDLPGKFVDVGVMFAGRCFVVATAAMARALVVQGALISGGSFAARGSVGHRISSLAGIMLRLALARQLAAAGRPRRTSRVASRGIRGVHADVVQGSCGRCGCSAGGFVTLTLYDGDGRGGGVYTAWVTRRALSVGLE
jgi:hypothetical protein